MLIFDPTLSQRTRKDGAPIFVVGRSQKAYSSKSGLSEAPRVESQFHGVIRIETRRSGPGAAGQTVAPFAALTPAQRVFGHPAADGLGHAGPGDRVSARDVRGGGVRVRAHVRCVRWGLPESRLSLLFAGRRHDLHHV